RLGHNRRLAVARQAFDANLLRIHLHLRVLPEVGDQLADAPLPRAQRTPIVRLARLTLVDQTNDALPQTVAAAVRLDAVRIDAPVAPTVLQRLQLPWRSTTTTKTKTSAATAAAAATSRRIRPACRAKS